MEKPKLQRMLEGLPEQIDLDDLIERLSLLRHLEIVEQEIEEGKVISHDSVERRMAHVLLAL